MKLSTGQSTGNSAKLRFSQKLLFVVMGLAIAALLVAFYLFFVGSTSSGSAQSKDYESALLIAVFSSIVLSLASMAFQMGQVARANTVAPKMMTTIECNKCGKKTVREFQRGDFVFKELDACQCGGKQLITAIYKEIIEKEKNYGV